MFDRWDLRGPLEEAVQGGENGPQGYDELLAYEDEKRRVRSDFMANYANQTWSFNITGQGAGEQKLYLCLI